jgi:molybdopterin-guanine dinucleotide biosynthesis protein A
MSRTAIVLCGGRSSRMGRAKAWLPWFGRPMVEHVVEALRKSVDEIVVVRSPELDLPPLKAQVICDEEPGQGPLAGIRYGLEASSSEFAFVTSVDSPYLSAEYIEALFSFGVTAAPVADDHVQVLSAIYPSRAWKIATEFLVKGKRRPLALLEALQYKPVEVAKSSRRAAWMGFNTPDEYLDAVRLQDPAATAEVEVLGRIASKLECARFRAPVGTLGDVLHRLPESLGLISGGRVSNAHLVSLGGRDLVRDLALPVGPDEKVSVIDALAGG